MCPTMAEDKKTMFENWLAKNVLLKFIYFFAILVIGVRVGIK